MGPRAVISKPPVVSGFSRTRLEWIVVTILIGVAAGVAPHPKWRQRQAPDNKCKNPGQDNHRQYKEHVFPKQFP